jgi:hypothetical protein
MCCPPKRATESLLQFPELKQDALVASVAGAHMRASIAHNYYWHLHNQHIEEIDHPHYCHSNVVTYQFQSSIQVYSRKMQNRHSYSWLGGWRFANPGFLTISTNN